MSRRIRYAAAMETTGSLACVGLGMTLGAHLTPRSRSHIERADVVFVAASDPLVELWVQEMHADVRAPERGLFRALVGAAEARAVADRAGEPSGVTLSAAKGT